MGVSVVISSYACMLGTENILYEGRSVVETPRTRFGSYPFRCKSPSSTYSILPSFTFVHGSIRSCHRDGGTRVVRLLRLRHGEE